MPVLEINFPDSCNIHPLFLFRLFKSQQSNIRHLLDLLSLDQRLDTGINCLTLAAWFVLCLTLALVRFKLNLSIISQLSGLSDFAAFFNRQSRHVPWLMRYPYRLQSRVVFSKLKFNISRSNTIYYLMTRAPVSLLFIRIEVNNINKCLSLILFLKS